MLVDPPVRRSCIENSYWFLSRKYEAQRSLVAYWSVTKSDVDRKRLSVVSRSCSTAYTWVWSRKSGENMCRVAGVGEISAEGFCF